jgi:hypothetical protein
MKKALLFLGAFLGISVCSNASWIGASSSSQGDVSKSLSTLSGLVDERSVVLGSIKPATAESKPASLSGLGTVAKGGATRWKDVGTSQSVALGETELALAKNDAGEVPEAGTWAAGALISVAFLRRWTSRGK